MSSKTSLETMMDYGVDENNWTVYLHTTEEIGTEETERFIKSMDYLKTRATEVVINMNCTGGDIHNGLAIYDYIRNYNLPTTILVCGSAMSMGAIILQAADERILLPHAKIMVHPAAVELPYDGISNNAKWVKDSLKDNEELIKILYGRMKEKRPRYQLKNLKNKLKEGDWLMSAKQAVQLGLADSIQGEES